MVRYMLLLDNKKKKTKTDKLHCILYNIDTVKCRWLEINKFIW